MKMRKNGLEVDGFATSRIPIPSLPCMKKEVVLRCVAPPPERQVHLPHAEAAAVAEPVAVAVHEVCEQKRYKNRNLSLIVPVPCVADVKARWDAHANANANAPRPDVDAQ